MDTAEIWTAVDAQRHALAAELDRLTPAEWETPSLCAGWTVRDVAAHLTLQDLTIGQGLRLFARHPAPGMDRVIRDAARHRAELPTGELIALIRTGSHRANVGVTPRGTLIDILVHSQDITVPLGRPLPLDPVAAAEAASRVWATGAPWHAAKRYRGHRLTATDAAWTAGDGPVPLTGPIDALLMLLTGRPAALTVTRVQPAVGSGPVR
jgi:uncharacterized protein (TIGR03083 family)